MAEEVFPLQSLRAERAKRAQTAQHVLAAFVLMAAAMPHLQEHGAHATLAIFEILAAVLLVGTAARDLVRKRKGHGHDPIGWVEIAGAVMTTVEAVQRTRGRHHLSFVILSFVQPVMLLLFGIFDVRLSSIRRLKIDDDQIEVSLGLFFRRRVRWREAAGFRMQNYRVDFTFANGETRTVSLRGAKNRDAAMQWLAERLESRGLRTLGPAQ